MPAIKNKLSKNDIYQPYFTINMSSALNKPAKINGSYKKISYPKIGIYNGPGASHSWLWFVEILDAMGFWDIEFLDDQNIKNDGLNRLQVLLVSGGDTFAIAESLGKEGAERLKSFLDGGGLYIGSCAGAYLPLKSSLSPLNLFNFASVKISNLTKTLPKPVSLPEKFCTSYGCNYVFHPVREEVKISLSGFPSSNRNGELVVPIYGGPSFLPSEDAKTIASYTGFTKKTLFLTDRKLAHDTLIDKSAVVTKKLGNGQLFLLGPHLEHPHYPKGNILIAEMIYQGMSELQDNGKFSMLSDENTKVNNFYTLLRKIKSEVSNSRIVALALERTPITWLIGQKVYEPVKIRTFLEMVWSRFPSIEHVNLNIEEDTLLSLKRSFQEITQLLRDIKSKIDRGHDTTDNASYLFTVIKSSCADFLSIYFNNRLFSHATGKTQHN